jgi:glycosyltransferase involved in cell wall biosynthesis
VGYLGHLDIHVARLRFRRATLVLDHLVALGDTVRDRGLARRGLGGALDLVDRAALRAADVVLVDTEEHALALAAADRSKAVVVPVGAPSSWFEARPSEPSVADELTVVFFGLFTPLQGAPVIASALRSIPDVPLRCTMIGTGQDLETARQIIGDDDRVSWTDWVDADHLPDVVARHDVCLGIFGDTEKARRVVPNKVYQGAAAGCALVTSDTPPQRRLLRDRAVLVPPGDARALGDALAKLAADPELRTRLQGDARRLADEIALPAVVIRPLVERLARR